LEVLRMLPTLADFRDLIRAEGAALLAQLPTLTADQWRRSSPCQGWDVLDVVVHMQLGALVHATIVENAVAGRMQAPWDLPEGEDPSAWFRGVHREARDDGPAPNIEKLRARLVRYDAALASATPDQLDAPAWFYGLPATLQTVVSVYLFEIIVHASDIRRTIGLEPWFSEAGSQYAGRASLPMLPMFVSAERLAGAAGVVRQEIDGAVTFATLGPDGLTLAGVETDADSAGGPVEPAATLITDGGTWTLLSWRGLPIAEAERLGRATLTGDRALVERYLGAIKTP
jgi:uncharacterized protein (TIGR03083 family)